MQRFRHRRWIRGVVLAVIGLAALGACSSEDDSEGEGSGGVSNGGASGSSGKFGGSGGSGASATGGTTGTGTGGSTGGTAGTTGSGGAGGSGNVEPCVGLPFTGAAGAGDPDASSSGGAAGACTGTSQEVERIDVDLLFMMDRSISLNETVAGGGTRWEALRTAMQALAVAPQAASLQAGIGFFSISGSGNDAVDCPAAAYSTPAVPIAPLSQSGTDIIAEIDARSPGGLTPLVPALQGALSYAKTWAQANPDRAAAVVLVSDGYPTQCSNDPIAIADAAAAALADTPSVRTFIIGIGEIAQFNLDNYARSGGTNEPFIVSDANVVDDFVDTVLNIAVSNLACDFRIPDPPTGQIDPEKVVVSYTPASTGEPEEIPRVASLGACAASKNGGWYYDNPTKPTKIFVCPCTCARFGAGGVDVRFGCRPRFG
jgi:hypothetical protein